MELKAMASVTMGHWGHLAEGGKELPKSSCAYFDLLVGGLVMSSSLTAFQKP